MATGIAVGDVPQLVLDGRWSPPRALLGDMWRARELCLTLARKDFFVKYRRASFGVLWAVALPGLQAVVLGIILSRLTNLEVAHYPVFIFGGAVLWSYLASTVGGGATSIVDNTSLSSKIYFPRAILPLAVGVSNLFALGAGLIVLLFAMAITGDRFTTRVLLIVPGALLMALLASTLALVLSALHVYFRDIQYLVQAVTLVWFYVTPVFYPLGRLHGIAHTFVTLNPATGPIRLFHAATNGGGVGLSAIVPTLVAVALLVGAGLALHCRLDRSFADLM